jgi:hypothetical protein
MTVGEVHRLPSEKMTMLSLMIAALRKARRQAPENEFRSQVEARRGRDHG